MRTFVVPAGTIPSGSGMFRGSEKSPHLGGNYEQGPLLRLLLWYSRGHGVRCASLLDGRGEGSSPRAARSPRPRVFSLRRSRILFRDGGNAGKRQALRPENILDLLIRVIPSNPFQALAEMKMLNIIEQQK